MYIPFAYRTSLTEGTGSFNVEYLVVAGGGAGGVGAGGGGGAGGVKSGTLEFTTATTYSIDVGAGALSDGYVDCPTCTEYTMRRNTPCATNPTIEYTECITGTTKTVTLTSLVNRNVFSRTLPVKISGCAIVGPTFVRTKQGDFCNYDRTINNRIVLTETGSFVGPFVLAQWVDWNGNLQVESIPRFAPGTPDNIDHLSGSFVYSNQSGIGKVVNPSPFPQTSSNASEYTASNSTLQGGSDIVVNVTTLGGGNGESTIYGQSTSGGSGGGGGIYIGTGSVGTVNQGNDGGDVYVIVSGSEYATAGGGGSLSAGGDGSLTTGGDGGDGILWLDGNNYSGGGAGIYFPSGSGSNGSGGTGGGGNPNTSATQNTGGGGGGSYYSASFGADGIVKLRYPGPIILATGGTITESGGYVYHTFLSGSHEFITTGSL